MRPEPASAGGIGAGGAKPLSRSRSRPCGVMRSDVQGGVKLIRTSIASATPSSPTRRSISVCMTPMAGQPTKVGSSSIRAVPSSVTATEPMTPRSTSPMAGISGSGNAGQLVPDSPLRVCPSGRAAVTTALLLGAGDHRHLVVQPAELVRAALPAVGSRRGVGKRPRDRLEHRPHRSLPGGVERAPAAREGSR